MRSQDMELTNSGNGNYIISEKAFEDIARIACSNIKNVFPAKKEKESVVCRFSKNGELTVKLSVRVKKGIDIVKLCSKIQDEVRENILMMTGVDCNKINIDIQGFEQ